jgi:anti-anti-sigma factor
VDIASAGEVRDLLFASINRGGIHLVVDATSCTFMDSTGVNALVRARERAVRLGGSIHVVTASRPVLRVLEVTQLDRLLAVVSSIDDAQACLAHPPTIHSCTSPVRD